MIFYLTIFTINTFLHVYDGFHITCRNFHHNGNPHITVQLFQLVKDRAFSQILYIHINGGNDVRTINRGRVHDVKKPVEHLSAMNNTVTTAQNRIVRQFQSATRSVFCTKQIAHRTTCQRTVRALTSIKLLSMETAFIFCKVENG